MPTQLVAAESYRTSSTSSTSLLTFLLYVSVLDASDIGSHVATVPPPTRFEISNDRSKMALRTNLPSYTYSAPAPFILSGAKINLTSNASVSFSFKARSSPPPRLLYATRAWLASPSAEVTTRCTLQDVSAMLDG